MFERRCDVSQQKKAPAASLFSRKQVLGVPIHITMSSILINIYYYTLLLSLISIILIAYRLPPRAVELPKSFLQDSSSHVWHALWATVALWLRPSTKCLEANRTVLRREQRGAHGGLQSGGGGCARPRAEESG